MHFRHLAMDNIITSLLETANNTDRAREKKISAGRGHINGPFHHRGFVALHYNNRGR